MDGATWKARFGWQFSTGRSTQGVREPEDERERNRLENDNRTCYDGVAQAGGAKVNYAGFIRRGELVRINADLVLDAAADLKSAATLRLVLPDLDRPGHTKEVYLCHGQGLDCHEASSLHFAWDVTHAQYEAMWKAETAGFPVPTPSFLGVVVQCEAGVSVAKDSLPDGAMVAGATLEWSAEIRTAPKPDAGAAQEAAPEPGVVEARR